MGALKFYPFKLTISCRPRYYKVEMQDPGAGTLTTVLVISEADI